MSKYIYFILAVMLIATSVLAGCERSAAAPASLPTATPGNQPLAGGGSTEDPMAMLWAYTTQTAMASTPQPGATTVSPTPPAAGTAITPGVTLAPTITSVLPPTGIPGTQTTPIVTPVPVVTVTPGRPATYALQPGEFPYCIARRFNLNPEELLNLNGLVDGDLYQPGLVLQIPQTGSPFPGTRALHAHPSTYTVSSADDTIYRIACYYGDVDPSQIAAANGLVPPYILRAGQTLTIP